MPRKGWERLSPGYRKRLEKSGINQEQYNAGASLSKARGHSKTPERPRGPVDKKKYPEYYRKRQALINELAAKKQALWGDSPRWDSEKSLRNIRDAAPSNAWLLWAIEAEEADLIDAIREDSEAFRFLGYH